MGWQRPNQSGSFRAYICRQMAKSIVKSGLSKRALVQLSYAIGVAKPLSLFVETYGSECGELTADDITNIVKIEFDCRPGAIAQSLALREPKYQETAAYCHFGREPYTKDGVKFFEWENAKDLSKYKGMSSSQVTAALKGSNFLTKWVDGSGGRVRGFSGAPHTQHIFVDSLYSAVGRVLQPWSTDRPAIVRTCSRFPDPLALDGRCDGR